MLSEMSYALKYPQRITQPSEKFSSFSSLWHILSSSFFFFPFSLFVTFLFFILIFIYHFYTYSHVYTCILFFLNHIILRSSTLTLETTFVGTLILNLTLFIMCFYGNAYCVTSSVKMILGACFL
jgi:hypothetical protein